MLLPTCLTLLATILCANGLQCWDGVKINGVEQPGFTTCQGSDTYGCLKVTDRTNRDVGEVHRCNDVINYNLGLSNGRCRIGSLTWGTYTIGGEVCHCGTTLCNSVSQQQSSRNFECWNGAKVNGTQQSGFGKCQGNDAYGCLKLTERTNEGIREIYRCNDLLNYNLGLSNNKCQSGGLSFGGYFAAGDICNCMANLCNSPDQSAALTAYGSSAKVLPTTQTVVIIAIGLVVRKWHT